MSVCLIIGIISEVIKFFSVTRIVPMVYPEITMQNGAAVLQWLPSGEYTPYLSMEHLPLELCSLYLLFMLLVLALRDGGWKRGLYAVMFASGTIVGLILTEKWQWIVYLIIRMILATGLVLLLYSLLLAKKKNLPQNEKS